MSNELKAEWIRLMMKLKKLKPAVIKDAGLNPGELFALHHISMSHLECGNMPMVSGIHREMRVSRPAVSHMLSSLEKKGYIIRDINNDDRRRIAITLTSRGEELVRQIHESLDEEMEELVRRYGEDNMKKLITQLGSFLDVLEEIRKDSAGENKGDNRDD